MAEPRDADTRARSFQKESAKQAVIGGIYAGAAAVACNAVLSKYTRFANVRRQAKVVMLTMAVVAGFAIRGERYTFHAPGSRFYGYTQGPAPAPVDDARSKGMNASLIWDTKIKPFLIKERFKVGLAVWGTAMTGSLIYFSRIPLPFSQKLVQARVVAQGAVLVPLVLTAMLANLEEEQETAPGMRSDR